MRRYRRNLAVADAKVRAAAAKRTRRAARWDRIADRGGIARSTPQGWP